MRLSLGARSFSRKSATCVRVQADVILTNSSLTESVSLDLPSVVVARGASEVAESRTQVRLQESGADLALPLDLAPGESTDAIAVDAELDMPDGVPAALPFEEGLALQVFDRVSQQTFQLLLVG